MNLMNRLHNSTNHFQGDAKKVLCLCSAGLLRSPTTAVVLHREFGHNTRAAGVTEDYALIPVDNVLYHWATEIVAVEESIAKQIPEQFLHKVTVLNIPDAFAYMDPELQKMILSQYTKIHEDIS